MHCRATGLVYDGSLQAMDEGEPYKFRVREVCAEEVLSSLWVESFMITTIVVPIPEITFQIPLPGEEVFVSPELVVVLLTPDIEVNLNERSVVNLTRFESPGCPRSSFVREGSDFALHSDSSPGQVSLINSAIMTAAPPDGFWLSSCKYRFAIYPDVLRTILRPAKFNPMMQWDFDWAEIGPIRKNFYVQGMTSELTGTSMRLVVHYDKDANITCVATPLPSEDRYASGKRT
eukprot:CAMPEP_0176124650 /NCGR_PEP_ID=MMETSP0120_2-20121206/62852_1 /TAXON_ID=160619 /ORGANISM="Kryptoperidinium foliaceum, Strain CCMP 1326" /LENGTH=231 /DNA_ID=CAMNT_0017459437 /DNA_START=167 /DNA_END=858 /DNA_ORIENTATION=-